MTNTKATFYPAHYYHVYNRTNNKERLFRTVDNRFFFLKRYQKYLGDFLHIHAYALMSNHFHFSVLIKTIEEIEHYLAGLDPKKQTTTIKKFLIAEDKEDLIDALIIDQHRRFFISYSQSINNRFKRVGNLFNAKFKRSLFDPNVKFRYIQYYLHHNARKHRVCNEFSAYPYTSYHEIVQGDAWLIDINHVMEKFESLNNFIEFHEELRFLDVFEEQIFEE